MSEELYWPFSTRRQTPRISELFVTAREMKQRSLGSVHFRQALMLQKKKHHFASRPDRGIKPPENKLSSPKGSVLISVNSFTLPLPVSSLCGGLHLCRQPSTAERQGHPAVPARALWIRRANLEFLRRAPESSAAPHTAAPAPAAPH